MDIATDLAYRRRAKIYTDITRHRLAHTYFDHLLGEILNQEYGPERLEFLLEKRNKSETDRFVETQGRNFGMKSMHRIKWIIPFYS